MITQAFNTNHEDVATREQSGLKLQLEIGRLSPT